MKKHLFLKSLLIAIGLLVASINTAWANGGIGYKGVKFSKNGSTTGWYNIHDVANWDYVASGYECRSGKSGVTDFTNANLGTVTTLKLEAFVVIGWADGGDYVAGQLKYRLYKQGASAGSYSTYDVGNYSNPSWGSTDVLVSSDNNRVVGKSSSMNMDIVTSGTSPGNYYLQLQGLGRMQYTGGGGGSFNANNGTEVKATLTVPGFTTTSTSNAYGNVEVGSYSSTTISFTQHYGTTLTTSDCSLTNSTDFQVTSISETGVTVKFIPQTAGNKSCTLTITDANSKTCKISLTGTGTAPAETTHSVTVSYVCPSTSATVSTATTPDIGEVTYSEQTAPTVAGYTFANWTLGTGVAKHASDELTSNPIRVKTNSSGSGYTLTANYTEVLTTNWKVIGDNQSGSPFGDNYTYASGQAMSKKTGHSTEANAYKTIEVTKLPGDYYGFKVATAAGNTNAWGYGTGDGYYITFNRSASGTQKQVYNGDQHELKFIPDALGEYEFRVNYPGNKYVYVTFPTAYTVSFSKGSVNGTSGSISATYSSVSFSSGTKIQRGKSVTLVAPNEKTGYTWYGWCTNANGTGRVSTNKTYSPTISAATTLYACYTINNHSITHSDASHGSYTIQVGDAAAVSANTTSDYGKQITLAATPAPGYHFGSWSAYKTETPATTVTVTSNQFTMPDYAVTVGATFTPNTYTVHFHRNGGAGGVVEQNFTYDVAQNLTANTYTRTGYTFAGWALTTDGAVTHTDGAEVSNLTSENGATFHLYAKWTANPYTVVLDKQTSAEGYGGNAGTVANQTVTFDATLATVSGTMPTAAQGYGFMGFYSEAGGNGRRFIDPSGNWVTSAGDTISGGKWVKPAGITLYAYYKKAEITALTLDAVVVETNATVGVTPTVSPTPEGTTKLWFYVFHGNDNPLDPQPTITWNGTKATFNADETSGTYKIGVALRTGTTYAGTLLDSTTVSYQVAGTHSVTVRYKCGDDVIKAATTLDGIRPLDWSDEITAADIIGYSFTGWTAGDGVTIKDDDGEDKTTSSSATIKIKAIYDGYLTANYSKKRIIYFNNTLNWDTVVVYFYKNSSYWGSTQGSGASTTYTFTNTPYSEGKHGGMQRVTPGSNIWYFDAEAAGVNASYQTVVFTDKDQHGYGYFYDDAKVIKRDDYYSTKLPMFVPVATQTPTDMNSNKAHYYNEGYWMNYPENTGYTLKIYNKKETGGAVELKSIPFEFTENKTLPMELNVDLEAGKTYGFKIYRNDGLGDDSFYGNTGTMTANTEGWAMTTDASSNTGLQTTAAGDYKFILNYYKSGDYQYRVSVTYPVASGDYRLLYKDDVHSVWHPSAVIPKANAKDTVSFFVRTGQHAYLKLQKCTGLGAGTVTWTDTVTWWNNGAGIHSAVTQDSVYNICLTHNASTGRLEIENVEAYTGNYYIRVDAANSKWDNYRTDPDHLMTYSEYSITHGGYSHYYTHWVKTDNRKNIKFCIANDYSPCISDTLTRESNAVSGWENINSYIDAYGNILRNSNVRFMWDRHTNTVSRAYVDGAQGDHSSNFLYILNTDSPNKIRWADESALTSDKVTFSDNGNWIYEANIQAQPNAQIRLLSNWGTSNTITQYFKGSSSHSEDLVGGSGDTWYDIRVIYDFKTNRLLASWIPSGDISDEIEINADVMFIREHQGDIAQLTFSDDGIIKKIETAYGVLRFNKWTLNNKDKSTHAVLASPKSRYERDLFYVSFPFRVSMEDVFGFGTYGTHWIIEEYDGANRAAKGYWAESAPNWKFVLDRKGKFFEPNQGYIIALELDELGESSSVWQNTDQVELYFPSYGTMSDITKASVNCTIPEHLCTINRSEEIGGSGLPLGPEYDRRVKDSHWNVISVPTYINTSNATFANTDWITAGDGHVGPNFLYEWNPDDNTVTARSGVGYTYKAMHAYLVQYCGVITWTTSVSPAAAPRRNPAYRGNYEFRLEILQNDEAVDQTFVKLSDEEAVTTSFEFNYDLIKEFNKNRSNIYTLIGTEPAAGNELPLTDQTTVVPVGVIAKTDGDYTFSIPDGTEGIGVTLIDNETGIRTSLSAVDYTINLSAGTYDDRFLLEISPIKHVATGVETVNEEGVATNGARKIMIDGLLYIVKDGKVFDAQGRQVK